jgi:hypothetical protein
MTKTPTSAPDKDTRPLADQDNRPLADSELDAVTGGSLTNSTSQAIKNLGEALATMARKQ